MRKLILATLIWLLAAVGAFAQTEAERLRTALDQVSQYDWDGAIATARGGSALTRDIITWHALRGSFGTFRDYQTFLARHPDWPGLELMRRVGEAKIPDDAAPADVFAYFSGQLPQTGDGSLHLAKALSAAGAGAVAADELRRAWLTMDLPEAVFQSMLNDHEAILQDQHVARLDRLLWDQKTNSAEDMLPLVDEDHRKLAVARIALLRGNDKVDALIAAVPEALRDSPGLAHARFVWRLKRGRRDDATALILERSARPGGLGRADAWASKRRELARIAMQDNRPKLAYRLASQHGLSVGSDYAALEWLAGFIALRQLDDPETAVAHFRRFRVAVFTPISLGRAGYWEGRALEAAGHQDAALHAYDFSAEFPTSFYGQLSAARIGRKPSQTGLIDTEHPELSETPLAKSSVLAAARLLHEAGATRLFRRFMRHLAEAGTPAEQAALGSFALELGEANTALYIAKFGANQGSILMTPYFPATIDLPEDLGIDSALALAIMRRESEFDKEAVSHAGARGLMQLMPRTAVAMAKELDLTIQVEDLTKDGALNVRLGAAYLAKLIDEFEGYAPAVASAYNAGPSRAKAWSGLPGYAHGSVDRAVDWVEAIPFSETRNYVMRVLEGYQTYKAILSDDDDWVLPDLLTGDARLSVTR